MATLQKIRNHGVGLIVIVGLAMLAFILGDFLNSGSTFFNRGRENIGEVAGRDIHYTEYENAREQLIEVYKIETGQTNFDDDFYSQVRNQIWQSKVMEYSLEAQTKQIGMDITPNELSELCFGDNPHQFITSRRTFFDEKGQFNRNNVVRFLASLEQDVDDPEQMNNLNQAKNWWMYWENAVRTTYLQDKYMNLATNLNQVNSLEAKYSVNAANTRASIHYVVMPFYDIADSTINVPTSEIKRLYKLRKQLYKQIPNRSIEYATFDIRPSEDDFNKVHDELANLVDSFVHTNDIANIVNPVSDIPFDERDYSEEMVPERYKEFAFGKNAKKGDTTSLILDGDTYTMARLIKCNYKMPDSVKLKVVATQEGQEDTELGWYSAIQLNKNIAEPAFKGKKGERFTVKQGTVEQTFEIMDISVPTPKVQLAIMERLVTPSSKTYSALYNQVKQLIGPNNTVEKFETMAKEENLTLKPQRNILKHADRIANLASSRPIVRWAFEAKEGQVSDVFECGDVFVVAALTEVNDEEYRTMEQVRGELSYEITNDIKFEQAAKAVSNLTTLDEVAQKWGKTVETAENINLKNGRIGNNGYEPAVLGMIGDLNANELSKPIQGQRGVYVVYVDTKETQAAEEASIKQEKTTLQQQSGQSLAYRLITLIQSKTEVVDNRYNFQ